MVAEIWKRVYKAFSAAGFNGAATRWPRKSLQPGSTVAQALRLQWGRDQMAAEMCQENRDDPSRHWASMGPRPDGRGNKELGMDADEVLRLLQWGRDQMAAEIFRLSKIARTIGPLLR